MEFKTVILRFRDLVTESSGTIARHKDMIDKKGYVWWGWWNKGNEKIPFSDLSTLSGAIKSQSEDFYLMDSGQRKLYKANCCAIEHFREKTPSPNKKYTPTYYNKQTYYAWFKFDKIEECDIDVVRKYTYVKVDSLFAENSSNYDKFYGKRIYSIDEMIQQNRTIWFVRDYDKKNDRDYEIQLLNSNIVEPPRFQRKIF